MLARLQSCAARVRTRAAQASTDAAVSPLRNLVNIFASLVGSHLGGAVLGLVFWILAAHTFTAAQVGVGAALVAAMTLLSELALLGVDTLLLERFKFVPCEQRWALFSTGLVVVAGTGTVVALAALGLLRVLRPDGVMGELSLTDAVLLVLATVVAAACAVFDQAAIGMGSGSIQLRRNLFSSLLRTALLGGVAVLHLADGYLILVAWIVGMVGSLFVSHLPHDSLPRSVVTGHERLRLIRANWRTSLGHHGLTLAMGAGALMLPVVVAALIAAQETAFFVQARLVSDTALALPFLLTVALFATALDLDQFRRTARYTIGFGVLFTCLLIGAAAAFGHWLLMLFGPQYARESLPLLLLLLGTGPVLVVKDHFAVLRRLQGRRVSGAVVMMLWAVAELSGAIAGGVTGSVRLLCVGWVALSATCALLVLPLLIKGIGKSTVVTERTYDSSPEARADRALAQFWTAYSESRTDRYHYSLRHPLHCLRAYRDIQRLPIVRLPAPSDRPGGRAVRRVLELRGPLGLRARWLGSAALAVPAEAAEHLRGPRAQTLRRKIRAAELHGVRCRLVGPAERRALLAQCDMAERSHVDARYRVLHPRNEDLLEHDLWLVAQDAAGQPLLLAVLPVDGAVATLRYFRTLGTGEGYSLSRYIGTHAVVAELSARGVRWLLDTAPPGAQTNGVRHFQRMVGFRYVRLRVGAGNGFNAVLPAPEAAVDVERRDALAGVWVR